MWVTGLEMLSFVSITKCPLCLLSTFMIGDTKLYEVFPKLCYSHNNNNKNNNK